MTMLTTISFVFLFLLSSTSSGIFNFTHAQATWCVAKPSVPIAHLIETIDLVCNGLLADCKDIQPGGACFKTNEAGNHASVVMNLFYQKFGRQGWNCDFGGTAVLTITDPSYGDCKYAYGA